MSLVGGYAYTYSLQHKKAKEVREKMFGRIGQGFGRLGGSRHMSSEVKKVTLIPGDGIGPEIAQSVQRFVQPKSSFRSEPLMYL